MEEGLAAPDVPVLDAVDDVGVEGGEEVEVGEFELRHELSSEDVTISTSETPPARPLESIMTKTIDVPRATTAFQSKEVGPTGGDSRNALPPGMIAL